MPRPAINSVTQATELKKWYWLKSELVGFCKEQKINYSGSKFEIIERIANVLDFEENANITTKKVTSSFNWAKSQLMLETIITDSYTNGPNTRRFFKEHCGEKFHFNIPFMAWMKTNTGETLADAVQEWKKQNAITKTKGIKSEIPEGNQYNQYLRDFFEANPNKTMKEARHFWKLKRALPLGKHKYELSDLDL
jgi:Domain of unknown function (DUF6434)/SAP domain-containing new25